MNLLGNEYLPAAMHSSPVTIDPAAGPELQPFNVRLKAFRGLTTPKYAYSNVATMVMPFRQAGTVTVSKEDVGLHVSWTNASLAATSIVVKRSAGIAGGVSFQDIATLPGTATSYDDPGVPPGAFTYSVEARVVTLPSTLSNIRLQPAILTLPASTSFAEPGPDGAWWLAGINAYTYQVFRPVGGAWTTRDFPEAKVVFPPQFRLDAQGRPHMVYMGPVTEGANTYVINHAWHDGTDWQAEEVTRPVPNTQTERFYLDAQGQPVVLWNAFIGMNNRLGVAFKDGSGTWKVEDLTLALPDMANASALDLAPDASGAPVVLVVKDRAHHLLRRQMDGTWTSEALPTDGGLVELFPFLAALAATPDGDLHMIHDRFIASGDARYEVMYLRRSGGTWSQPRSISLQREYRGYGSLVASPAGDRLAFMAYTEGAMTLFVLEGGSLKTVTMGNTAYKGIHLGFTAAGKLRLLVACGSPLSGTGTENYVQFVEP